MSARLYKASGGGAAGAETVAAPKVKRSLPPQRAHVSHVYEIQPSKFARIKSNTAEPELFATAIRDDEDMEV